MPLLTHLLTAVAAALMVGVAAQKLLHSAALGAAMAALVFAVVVVTRSRQFSLMEHVEDREGDEAADLAQSTRASAARLALACVTGVLLSTVLSICLAAPSVMQAGTAGAVALAVALTIAALLARVNPNSPSTLVVGGIVVMLAGQLIAAGGAGLSRTVIAVALIGLAWGLAAAGAVMLRPTGHGIVVAGVGAATALVSGLLVHAGNPASALLLPVLLLAPAMISAIWAEVINLAGDRYLGDGKPRRRR